MNVRTHNIFNFAVPRLFVRDFKVIVLSAFVKLSPYMAILKAMNRTLCFQRQSSAIKEIK